MANKELKYNKLNVSRTQIVMIYKIKKHDIVFLTLTEAFLEKPRFIISATISSLGSKKFAVELGLAAASGFGLSDDIVGGVFL